MIDPQQCHSPAEGLRGLLRGVVEDLEADGIVVVLPVYLVGLILLAACLDVRLCVFHFK
jgi:hypothetical protein